MAHYLTFQLYGMLSAFGLVAVGEVRLSAAHPTRSAVMGLLAACLGIRRGEEERLAALSAGYVLAVRVDNAGTPLLDYHTIQTPPEKSKRTYHTRADELGGLLGRDEEPYTILSRRGYLCSAYFTVGLRAATDAPPHPLETLAEALRRPVFTPYLGRKCCPASLPFAPKIGEYATVEEALAAYRLDPRAFPHWAKRPEKSLLVADEAATPTNVTQCPLVRDLATHHGRRQFAERRAVEAETAPGQFRQQEDGHVSQ